MSNLKQAIKICCLMLVSAGSIFLSSFSHKKITNTGVHVIDVKNAKQLKDFFITPATGYLL